MEVWLQERLDAYMSVQGPAQPWGPILSTAGQSFACEVNLQGHHSCSYIVLQVHVGQPDAIRTIPDAFRVTFFVPSLAVGIAVTRLAACMCDSKL